MTEVPVRLLPIVLLLACSGNSDKSPGTADTGGPTTGAVATTGTPATGTGTGTGTGPKQYLAGAFAPHFDGLAAPAPCAVFGLLCYDVLPSGNGAYLDPAPATFDAIASGVSWVGNELDIGGFALPFEVDVSTGFGYYVLQINGSGLDALDVRLSGEWGDWVGPQALPVGEAVLNSEPIIGGYLGIEDSLDIAWDAPTGTVDHVYVEVEVELGTTTFHRIWSFDNGTVSIPLAEIEDIGTDIATVKVYRVQDTSVLDANGNDLTVQSWSVTKYIAGLGATGAATCAEILAADPSAVSGTYYLQPDPALPPLEVWCDMTTDGGGWTLVASSNSTFDDLATGYASTLSDLEPTSSMSGVWSGLRAAVPGTSDIRFACKTAPENANMAVDLSFYDVGWYQQITSGPSDADSCFNESNGSGWGTPPERKNNLSGVVLPLGDQYSAGYMESEDSCSDTGDFTVDFDDRGMDSNQSDGTDWGEDDSQQKCGTSGLGSGAWFIFVR